MKTKIIATIGPTSEDPKILEAMVSEGMDIARMNFSHCTQDEYIHRVKHLKKIAAHAKKKIAIMQDLQGPRLRVGVMPSKGRLLQEDEMVVFSTEKLKLKSIIHIDDPYLHADIKEGDPIYLANGAIELVVTKVSGTQITARVRMGGVLFSHKAVNVPNTTLTTSGMTQKDVDDVAFALEQGVTYIALSFVQSAADVIKLRSLVGNKVKIVSKIERALALKHIDEIIQASDALMVARGDLGAEIPVEDVPFIQKNLIRHAYWHNKGSITATQMLLSMVQSPHPTRAEVSDVANAVIDGSDAVMLSDETASGKYPIQAVATMARIITRAERHYYNKPNLL